MFFHITSFFLLPLQQKLEIDFFFFNVQCPFYGEISNDDVEMNNIEKESVTQRFFKKTVNTDC